MKVEDSNKPIRIAQIIGKWNGGGVESVVMNYYHHIDRNNFQFDFIIDEDSRNVPIEKIEKLGGRIIFVPPYQKPFKYIRALKKVFKENKYRIVHSHINTLSVFPLYAAKKAGVKVRIAHSHSTTNKKEPLRNFLKNFLRLFSKKYATDFFACSELAGRYQFGNKTFDQGKVTIIHNAIDIERFKPDQKNRQEIRRELGVKDDTLVVGHVGRFVKQKNHKFLIKIFAEVHKQNPNSILVLVGEGPLLLQTINQVKKLGLEKSVKFLGQRKDIEKVYQAMDVFCLPSLYEGFGMVALEAQVAGIKCICSTSIPNSAIVTKNSMRIKLENNLWIKNILQKTQIRHFDINKNFDINHAASDLAIKYSKLNKLKILEIGMTENLGGIETFLYNLYTEIDGNIFTLDFLKTTKEKICYEDQIVKNGESEIHKLSGYPKRPFYFMHKCKKFINSKNYDIVHINKNSLAIPFQLIAANRSNAKVVIHSHNTGSNGGKIGNILHNINIKIFLRKKDILLSCSEKASKYFFGKKKARIIPNFINVDKFLFSKKNRNEIRKSLNINNDTMVLGHIGRFVDAKNHALLLDIFSEYHKRNQNSVLILIGDGPLKNEISQKAKKMQLDKNILFLGKRTDIEKLYSAMDCFILPSKYEGLPFVAIEAQASGLPCLISTNTDKDVKITNNCIFISPKDIPEWIKNIKWNSNREKYNNSILSSKYSSTSALKIVSDIFKKATKNA